MAVIVTIYVYRGSCGPTYIGSYPHHYRHLPEQVQRLAELGRTHARVQIGEDLYVLELTPAISFLP